MSEIHFRPNTSEIPTNPGVYRFIDDRNKVLYVGKAKNLRARLSSYFGNLDKLHERTQRMLQAASDVKWTIVNTEYDALQLEFSWIKQFEPPFNIRFRDDKSYPYIAIAVSEEVPRAFITRNREIPGVKYFGPYTQSWAVRETLDTLLKVFPVRSCSQGIYDRAKRANRPCLLADIGKCSAPCVGRIEATTHKALAKQLGSFIASGDETYVAKLRSKMEAMSEAENYEAAANFRDDVQALEKILEKSSVVLADQTDADFIGLSRDELSAAVAIFNVRGGRIRGARGMVVDLELDRDDSELIEYVLHQIYNPPKSAEPIEVPKSIYVPVLPKDKRDVSLWLSKLRGSKSEVQVALRGEKAVLAKTVETNARQSLQSYKLKRTADFAARADALAGIQKALGMPTAPLRIECFDISHLAGTGTVGSMVVFEDGLPRKNQYRKFNLEETDDAEAIYQVLRRRLKYLEEDTSEKFSYRPSLLLIDGGLQQRNAAARAVADSGIEDITVATLAKRLEEVFTTNSDSPVIFPRSSEELFLLQRIRDEAHRFAITAQRAKRTSSIASTLLDLPGLGETKVRLLIRKFGSLKRLKAASAEEIADLPGFSQSLASRLLEQLEQLP
jgi:excinuclease ABC subunit C